MRNILIGFFIGSSCFSAPLARADYAEKEARRELNQGLVATELVDLVFVAQSYPRRYHFLTRWIGGILEVQQCGSAATDFYIRHSLADLGPSPASAALHILNQLKEMDSVLDPQVLKWLRESPEQITARKRSEELLSSIIADKVDRVLSSEGKRPNGEDLVLRKEFSEQQSVANDPYLLVDLQGNGLRIWRNLFQFPSQPNYALRSKGDVDEGRYQVNIESPVTLVRELVEKQQQHRLALAQIANVYKVRTTSHELTAWLNERLKHLVRDGGPSPDEIMSNRIEALLRNMKACGLNNNPTVTLKILNEHRDPPSEE